MRRSVAPRRSSLKPYRRKAADRTDPDERAAVLRRDGGCVAFLLGASGPCRGPFGQTMAGRSKPEEWLTVDHVRKAGMPRRLSPMVTLCYAHGIQAWELSHRDLLLSYLRFIGPDPYGPLVAPRIAAQLALRETG